MRNYTASKLALCLTNILYAFCYKGLVILKVAAIKLSNFNYLSVKLHIYFVKIGNYLAVDIWKNVDKIDVEGCKSLSSKVFALSNRDKLTIYLLRFRQFYNLNY